MTVKQDIKALQKEYKALGKKLEKLIVTAEKSEKPKSAKKTTAKTAKRSPAQKAPAKKKTAQPTASDQVLNIIKRSKGSAK